MAEYKFSKNDAPYKKSEYTTKIVEFIFSYPHIFFQQSLEKYHVYASKRKHKVANFRRASVFVFCRTLSSKNNQMIAELSWKPI